MPAEPARPLRRRRGAAHEAAINAAPPWASSSARATSTATGATSSTPPAASPAARWRRSSPGCTRRCAGSLPTPTRDHFEDDDGSTFAASIGALAELGVITGVGDRDGDGRNEFDPDGFVSRAQMATFIANELALLVAAGDAEPGGAEVYLDRHGRWPRGGTLNGDVETNKVVVVAHRRRLRPRRRRADGRRRAARSASRSRPASPPAPASWRSGPSRTGPARRARASR